MIKNALMMTMCFEMRFEKRFTGIDDMNMKCYFEI